MMNFNCKIDKRKKKQLKYLQLKASKYERKNIEERKNNSNIILLNPKDSLDTIT